MDGHLDWNNVGWRWFYNPLKYCFKTWNFIDVGIIFWSIMKLSNL